MIFNKDNIQALNHFMTPQGAEAIETLGNILLEFYSTQMYSSEGYQVYRDQGACKIANLLKTLPKSLRDGHAALSK